MIFEFFAILLLSILIHEVGHFMALRLYGKDVEIRFYFKSIRNFGFKVGQESDYDNLTKYELCEIYLAGVIIGTIPIVIWLVQLDVNLISIYYIVSLCLLYVSGCWSDLSKLWSILVKGEL